MPRIIARSGGGEKARIGQVLLAFGQMHAKPMGPAGTAAPARSVARVTILPGASEFLGRIASSGEMRDGISIASREGA
jgi:hypothetical protein